MTLNHTYDDSLISDLYKDAYGSRPSQTYWTLWRSMTPSQKQGEWEYLCKLVEEADDARLRAEEGAYQYWSSNIRATMAKLNISEAEAIRKDMSDCDCINDIGFYCFKRGLSYSTEYEIDNILKGK